MAGTEQGICRVPAHRDLWFITPPTAGLGPPKRPPKRPWYRKREAYLLASGMGERSGGGKGSDPPESARLAHETQSPGRRWRVWASV